MTFNEKCSSIISCYNDVYCKHIGFWYVLLVSDPEGYLGIHPSMVPKIGSRSSWIYGHSSKLVLRLNRVKFCLIGSFDRGTANLKITVNFYATEVQMERWITKQLATSYQYNPNEDSNSTIRLLKIFVKKKYRYRRKHMLLRKIQYGNHTAVN